MNDSIQKNSLSLNEESHVDNIFIDCVFAVVNSKNTTHEIASNVLKSESQLTLIEKIVR